MSDPFHALFDGLSDESFRKALQDNVEQISTPRHQVSNATYRACFTSPAGLAVLRDLYNQFFNVQRFIPGEPPEAGYWREGAATLVQYIAAKVEADAQGDEDDGDES